MPQSVLLAHSHGNREQQTVVMQGLDFINPLQIIWYYLKKQTALCQCNCNNNVCCCLHSCIPNHLIKHFPTKKKNKLKRLTQIATTWYHSGIAH